MGLLEFLLNLLECEHTHQVKLGNQRPSEVIMDCGIAIVIFLMPVVSVILPCIFYWIGN